MLPQASPHAASLIMDLIVARVDVSVISFVINWEIAVLIY